MCTRRLLQIMILLVFLGAYTAGIGYVLYMYNTGAMEIISALFLMALISFTGIPLMNVNGYISRSLCSS